METDANTAKAGDDLGSLSAIWNEQFHETHPNLHSDSDGSRDVETLHTCILWANIHLGFLPGFTPEEVMAIAGDAADVAREGNWKTYWVDKVRAELHLTAGETVTAGQILQSQRTELARLPDECELLRDVYGTVNRIIDW